MLIPFGASIGVQQFRNDGTDPSDPVFTALPIVYSRTLSFGAEITGGDHTFPFSVKDCGSDAPIILLNIISARSMVRSAPKVARALLIDASAMNT